MTVAFLGINDFWQSPQLVIRMWNVLHVLINDGADVFLFSNDNYFDRTCYEMISQLKMHHSNIELHYHHGGFFCDVGNRIRQAKKQARYQRV